MKFKVIRFDGHRRMSDVLAELAEVVGGTWHRNPDDVVPFILSGRRVTTMAKAAAAKTATKATKEAPVNKKAARAMAKTVKKVARVQKAIDKVDKKIAKLQSKKTKLEAKRDGVKSKSKK